jgi:hypothetical protein
MSESETKNAMMRGCYTLQPLLLRNLEFSTQRFHLAEEVLEQRTRNHYGFVVCHSLCHERISLRRTLRRELACFGNTLRSTVSDDAAYITPERDSGFF